MSDPRGITGMRCFWLCWTRLDAGKGQSAPQEILFPSNGLQSLQSRAAGSESQGFGLHTEGFFDNGTRDDNLLQTEHMMEQELFVVELVVGAATAGVATTPACAFLVAHDSFPK